MSTLWNDMRFLAGKSETETEWFKTNGAFCLVFGSVMAGDHWERCRCHISVRVVFERSL